VAGFGFFPARMQRIVQLEHAIAGAGLEQEGENGVHHAAKAAANQHQTIKGRMDEMLPIAFADRARMFRKNVQNLFSLSRLYKTLADNIVSFKKYRRILTLIGKRIFH
jgi:hypothetical protein